MNEYRCACALYFFQSFGLRKILLVIRHFFFFLNTGIDQYPSPQKPGQKRLQNEEGEEGEHKSDSSFDTYVACWRLYW